jgi:hypothetical protein
MKASVSSLQKPKSIAAKDYAEFSKLNLLELYHKQLANTSFPVSHLSQKEHTRAPHVGQGKRGRLRLPRIDFRNIFNKNLLSDFVQ